MALLLPEILTGCGSPAVLPAGPGIPIAVSPPPNYGSSYDHGPYLAFEDREEKGHFQNKISRVVPGERVPLMVKVNATGWLLTVDNQSTPAIGLPVQFSVSRGGGRCEPALVTTDSAGYARTTYIADTAAWNLNQVSAEVALSGRYTKSGVEIAVGDTVGRTERFLADLRPVVATTKRALQNRDLALLATLIDQENGVYLGTNPCIAPDSDGYRGTMRLKPADLAGGNRSRQLYVWGYRDGSGDTIELTIRSYFDQWIPDLNRGQVIWDSYSENRSNHGVNLHQTFPNSFGVEIYFPGEGERDEHDYNWWSIILVYVPQFEHGEVKRFDLVAIARNNWAI